MGPSKQLKQIIQTNITLWRIPADWKQTCCGQRGTLSRDRWIASPTRWPPSHDASCRTVFRSTVRYWLTHGHTHRRNDAYHVSQGSALTAPLGYVTFRYMQEHWLLSTHTLPSSHFPSGQWQPSVQGELHLALSLLIFRQVRGHDDPHSLYSNPAGHCKAARRKWLVWNVFWALDIREKLHYLNIMYALLFVSSVSVQSNSCFDVQSAFKTRFRIRHVWYINILTSPEALRTNFYIWYCFLCLQVSFGAWQTKETLKIYHFDPKAWDWNIERGLLFFQNLMFTSNVW